MSSSSGYADLKQVKQRVNISDSVTQADEKIQNYMTEADDYIDTQAGIHDTVPFTNPDKELISLASGMAAALYNHWNKQGEFEIVKGYQHRIQEHIMAVYGKKNLESGLTGNTFSKTQSQVRGTESGTVS